MTTPTKPTPAAAAAANTNTEEKPNANTPHSHDNLHVSWDEETIALHDKERGTRMKIDEPKTPYHTYSGGDGEASPALSLSGKEELPPLEWSELQVKLAHVETKQQQKSEWDSSDDDSAASPGPRFAQRDAEGKKIEHDPQFAAKRKNHYNEFQAMKMWRQSHPDDDGDVDDDDANKKADDKVAGGEKA